MTANDYIKDLFLFQDTEIKEIEFATWKKHIKLIEPIGGSRKVDFLRTEMSKILEQSGKDLFTTWLVMYGEINELYLDKLWLCKKLYTKEEFQAWYWYSYKKYWYLSDRLKECDLDYKYKGIANALKAYITGGTDEILIRLICTDDIFESTARWIGKPSDAIRFADHFKVELKRLNKTFNSTFKRCNLRSETYKDQDRIGILKILDSYN
jgi:hypothetical protein